MGRNRSVHVNLPRGMRARVRPSATYYYLDIGEREIPLGKDYPAAMRQWRELTGGNAPIRAGERVTFRKAAERYIDSPRFLKKAPRTQRDNMNELGHLFAFFDNPPVPLESIQPHHIAKYRDWRESTHSTQEIALLSAIWSWAREQGITALANPTTGVRRNKGTGRDVYVDDVLYARVYSKADQPTRDAMDLARLAAQRPGDNLKMQTTDIHYEPLRPADLVGWHPPQVLPWDGRVVTVSQGKTGAKLRVRVKGELAQVIDRIRARRRVLGCLHTVLCTNEKGQPLTAAALDGRFGKAREAAGVQPLEFQMRDLRAKAGTEIDDDTGQQAAQSLLGHTTPAMTNRYIRHRQGKLVDPVHQAARGDA